jgi:hypothetical protein
VITASHSALAAFRACPALWRYRYVEARESTAPKAEALTKGGQIDLAVTARISGETPDLSEMAPDIRALVRGHAAYYGEPDETLVAHATHMPFRFPITPEIEMVGELDAIGIRKDTGAKVIYELKSSSQDISAGSPYWERVSLTDPQVSLYLRASQALGWGANEVLYDVMRKPELRRSEAKSRKTGPETDEEFEQRCLEDIAARPEHYFRRERIVRLESEVDAHVRDVEGTVHLMQVAREMGDRAPRNVDSCFKFGSRCEFYLACGSGADIHDPALYRERVRSSARETLPAPTTLTPIHCAICGVRVLHAHAIKTWIRPGVTGWRHAECSPFGTEQELVEAALQESLSHKKEF